MLVPQLGKATFLIAHAFNPISNQAQAKSENGNVLRNQIAHKTHHTCPLETVENGDIRCDPADNPKLKLGENERG